MKLPVKPGCRRGNDTTQREKERYPWTVDVATGLYVKTPGRPFVWRAAGRTSILSGWGGLLKKAESPGSAKEKAEIIRELRAKHILSDQLTAAGMARSAWYYHIDILPGLKAGDSYGAQAWYWATHESLRWIPTVGGITAPLTLQANRACPALKTLIASTRSAFSPKPHSTHKNRTCVWGAADTWPQHGQVRLKFCGGSNVSSRCICCAHRRLGHIPYL